MRESLAVDIVECLCCAENEWLCSVLIAAGKGTGLIKTPQSKKQLQEKAVEATKQKEILKLLNTKKKILQERAVEATKQKEEKKKNLSPRNKKACHSVNIALLEASRR
jgi:hypothetical protein